MTGGAAPVSGGPHRRGRGRAGAAPYPFRPAPPAGPAAHRSLRWRGPRRAGTGAARGRPRGRRGAADASRAAAPGPVPRRPGNRPARPRPRTAAPAPRSGEQSSPARPSNSPGISVNSAAHARSMCPTARRSRASSRWRSSARAASATPALPLARYGVRCPPWRNSMPLVSTEAWVRSSAGAAPARSSQRSSPVCSWSRTRNRAAPEAPYSRPGRPGGRPAAPSRSAGEPPRSAASSTRPKCSRARPAPAVPPDRSVVRMPRPVRSPATCPALARARRAASASPRRSSTTAAPYRPS